MSRYKTEQRQKLLEIFKNNGHQYLSASDIQKKCSNEDISLSAIYRNLKSMEQDGLISKVIDGQKSEAHYHFVDPDCCVGSIHLKCESCDRVYHLNRHISNMIFGFAKDELNFSINNVAAFLQGKCENCSQIHNK